MPVRVSVIFVLGMFVAVGFAPPSLIGFGVVDLVAALWTKRALVAARG